MKLLFTVYDGLRIYQDPLLQPLVCIKMLVHACTCTQCVLCLIIHVYIYMWLNNFFYNRRSHSKGMGCEETRDPSDRDSCPQLRNSHLWLVEIWPGKFIFFRFSPVVFLLGNVSATLVQSPPPNSSFLKPRISGPLLSRGKGWIRNPGHRESCR